MALQTGEMAFEDGTVVITKSDNPRMFTVDEIDVELIEQWREEMLELLRDAYESRAK